MCRLLPSFLVFENFRTVKCIVTSCVTDMEKRKQLFKDVKAVSDYLKHGYMHHVDMDPDPEYAIRPALLAAPTLSNA